MIDKSLSELAFQIGIIYDDYSVEKKEKIAKMIVAWKEKEKWTNGFAAMQAKVNFEMECERCTQCHQVKAYKLNASAYMRLQMKM